MKPTFDRYDIAEAYYCISMEFNPSERIDRRLKSMKFKPPGYLWLWGKSQLTDNGKAIYNNWVTNNPDKAIQ